MSTNNNSTSPTDDNFGNSSNNMIFSKYVLETLPENSDNVDDAVYIEYHRNSHRGFYICKLCETVGQSQSRRCTSEAIKYHCQEPAHHNNVLQLKQSKNLLQQLLQRWNHIHMISGNTSTGTSSAVTARGGNSTNNSKSRLSLQERIQALGLSDWKDAVLADLYRYLEEEQQPSNVTNNDDNSNNNGRNNNTGRNSTPSRRYSEVEDNNGSTTTTNNNRQQQQRQEESDGGNSNNPPVDYLQRALLQLQKFEHYERLSLLHLVVWKSMCLSEMPKLHYHESRMFIKSGWKICGLKSEYKHSNAMSIVITHVIPFLESPSTSTVKTRWLVPPGETARGHPWNSGRQQQSRQGRSSNSNNFWPTTTYSAVAEGRRNHVANNNNNNHPYISNAMMMAATTTDQQERRHAIDATAALRHDEDDLGEEDDHHLEDEEDER